MDKAFVVRGRLVDPHQQRIYAAEIAVEGERIISITPVTDANEEALQYIMPGFVDAHIHIESSMLIPSEFARLAVVHGTVATVSDPHEIANVCGIEGVEYMISNGRSVPFKFNFGAPSCVPATTFETAGAALDSKAIDELLRREEVLYLSEMMNFPGVLHQDEEVMKKIAAAQKYNKPVDGHAPGLRGDEARRYIAAGISTDHECFTREEAEDKLRAGMKVIIREGSAAKNFEALIDLLNDHPDMIMFCSDDKHPDSLVDGHINQLCARAVAKGIDIFKVVKAACVNPVNHYKLKVGLLRINDFADFVLVRDLQNFEVVQTYINGALVAENGQSLLKTVSATTINNFSCAPKDAAGFRTAANEVKYAKAPERKDLVKVPVIKALDGQLITERLEGEVKLKDDAFVTDIEKNILKIVVVNRYRDAPVATAFVKGFGLRWGAIASSVAHDSHNIVSVGVDDESIAQAVNLVIGSKGGISCVGGGQEMLLSLPVAGLMSTEDGYQVAKKYSEIDRAAKALGSPLGAPFMTLSFMALLVIPHLKLSDLGLFDGDSFSIISF